MQIFPFPPILGLLVVNPLPLVSNIRQRKSWWNVLALFILLINQSDKLEKEIQGVDFQVATEWKVPQVSGSAAAQQLSKFNLDLKLDNPKSHLGCLHNLDIVLVASTKPIGSDQ